MTVKEGQAETLVALALSTSSSRFASLPVYITVGFSLAKCVCCVLYNSVKKGFLA